MIALANRTTKEKAAVLFLAAAILFCSAAKGESILVRPPAEVTFNSIDAYEARVVFPNGSDICFTYNFGAPLGVEKRVLEPSLPLREIPSH